MKSVGMGKGENPESRIGGTWKSGNVSRGIDSIAGKCDRLPIVGKKEAGRESAVGINEIIGIRQKLIFVKMTGLRKNGKSLLRKGFCYVHRLGSWNQERAIGELEI